MWYSIREVLPLGSSFLFKTIIRIKNIKLIQNKKDRVVPYRTSRGCMCFNYGFDSYPS